MFERRKKTPSFSAILSVGFPRLFGGLMVGYGTTEFIYFFWGKDKMWVGGIIVFCHPNGIFYALI